MFKLTLSSSQNFPPMQEVLEEDHEVRSAGVPA